MSKPNVDDELVQEYLAESREHLTTIEADLLQIEEDGASIDEQLVNRVFRAAHSIKGGAGFFDFVKIRELAHKAENVLDMVRCRQLVPSSEIVSILLLAFDKLREMLEDYRHSNASDIGEFVDALTHLTMAHLASDQKHSLDQQVSLPVPNAARIIQVSAFDLSQARRGGRSIYLVEYDLIHDIHRSGKTPLAALRGLMRYGTILESGLDLESAGTLDDEPTNRLIMEVLYATPLEADLIHEVIELPPHQLRLIEKNGQAVSLAASPAAVVEPPAAAPAPLAPEPAPAPLANAAAAPEAAESISRPSVPAAEATIRLNVELLDSLMTLAGELVLSRNQLNEAVSSEDVADIRAAAHRLSLVTSEVQSAVALTRMQPVGALFAKFPRLVRDLGRDLAKQVQLKIEGGDVEIDKTILEGLSDPLTHMIRNSVDHGIEPSPARVAAGKPALGTVTLRASHQTGQVVIEIIDDGKGLPADKIAASALAKGMVTREQLETMSDRDKIMLIFLPGVSTAEKVSSVSGRGVGMDVVKTNLDKLGGKIEINSVLGGGTSFRIKLPLTLAIIPSLLVSNGGQRFALPQVSVGELIRIPQQHQAERIDRAGDGEVLLLRDRLVPLLHLSEALGGSRYAQASAAMNVVLVNAGSFEYGLVVDELHDTVEIVVKPLGRHLQGLSDYAGATILGDGQVAIILDVGGVAARAGLKSSINTATAAGDEEVEESQAQSLLLFENGPGEQCAVPIELVTRVERIRPQQVEYLGGRRTMQYGAASLPLVSLCDVASVGHLSEDQQWVVIVFERTGRPLGLLAAEPLDMVETQLSLDAQTLRQPGVAGSAILNGRTTLMLDIFELAGLARPETATEAQAAAHRAVDRDQVPAPQGPAATVLVAEDSDFFRGQIRRLIEGVGFQVLAAADGQEAWELLNQHPEVRAVATDLEMPRLDGLSLTRRIRADARYGQLPIIALSSLAGEEEIARALAEGVTEYQVKLDQDDFLGSIHRALGSPAASTTSRQ